MSLTENHRYFGRYGLGIHPAGGGGGHHFGAAASAVALYQA